MTEADGGKGGASRGPAKASSPPHAARADFSALGDRRAIVVLAVILVGVTMPFAARAIEPFWAAASPVAQARLFARLCVSFLLLACFPGILVLIRLGLTDVTAGQHRMILRVYPGLTSVWHCVVALDGFVLVARPALVSLPSFALDVAVSVASVALMPLVVHQQAWFYGFDARTIASAKESLERAADLSVLRAPLDTLDYRVLQLVARTGSDIAGVMINDMGIGYRDLMLRLQKLVALGYLSLADEMHGPQVVLTTLATDTLALPVSLFTWDTDDKELLTEIAQARLALEAREPQRVVVACARASERMLRGLLATVTPKVTHVGQKELSKATLGELVGACRQHKLIGRFEDSIFSAINERRKKIHALEGEGPIDDQDAFVIYTLTEIAARDIVSRRAAAERGGGG